MNLHFEQKGMFLDGEFSSYLIISSMPMVATYRPRQGHRTNYFVRENRESVLWKTECFFGTPVPKFWWQFCENQGRKNFVLASCSSTYVQDWTQLQIWQILRFFVELYKIYKNLLPQRFFGTLCWNLQFYANRPASTGLRILQNLQNLRFFATFTIFQ